MNDIKEDNAPFVTTDVLDDGDIASAYQMRETAIALEKAKLTMAPETHPDFDGETCVSCGEDIPQLRLAMHKVRCVHCQSRLELKGKLFAAPDKD